MLAGFRDIGKRLDAEMPRLFAELPRMPWGVRAMPSPAGPDAAENYSGPVLDGSCPGCFDANAVGYKTRPKWSMETLTAHEAVPGHHLQVSRALELGELLRFRRSGGYVAYSEGWGLYAETLGFELGLYNEPASRFGHLQWQMMRAARLVVDTGIHDRGWPRQRAIDYMVDNTGREAGFSSNEVDRYTSWPGQALGYMIGQLKIQELRDRARARPGDRFDIRRFHMAVLDQGTVPLWVLDRLSMTGWSKRRSAPEDQPAPRRRVTGSVDQTQAVVAGLPLDHLVAAALVGLPGEGSAPERTGDLEGHARAVVLAADAAL